MAAATLGLIGFGAIARQIHAALAPSGPRWIALLPEGSRTPLPADVTRAADLAALIAARPAAVIEAAGQGAVASAVPALLEAGLPVVIASTGALADAGLAARLHAAARTPGARLVVPSGAVGGMDYLRAIAALPAAQLRYTSRKPPEAWAEELAARGHRAGHGAVTLFEGGAEEAARLYPRNLNAALTVALAVGSARMTVRVIADPAACGNTHEIEARSAAGTAFMRFVNAPAQDNPKTSMLTALSLLAALQDVLSG